MKYLSIRQTSEKWVSPSEEYKFYVQKIEFQVQQRLVPIGLFRLMQKNPMMSVSRVENTLRKNKMQSVIKLFKCRWI